MRRPRFPDRCDGLSQSRAMASVRVRPRCGFATKQREIGGAAARKGPGTAQFEPRSRPSRAARVLPCCDDRGEKILPLMISPEPGMAGRARVIGSLTGDAVRFLLDAVDGGVVVLDLSEVNRADDSAVRVLAGLSRRCTLLSCPRWLELWLAQVGGGRESGESRQ